MKRRHFLAAGLTAATLGAAAAADTNASQNALGIGGFDHMSLNVRDFDGMLRWYQETLGLTLEIAWRVEALDGKRLAYLTLDGKRVLELVAADASGTGLRAPKTFQQHFGHIGYGHLCFASADVDLTMRALAERGAPAFVTAETYALDGTTFERRVAFVKDPEGNVLEFGEPLRRRG